MLKPLCAPVLALTAALPAGASAQETRDLFERLDKDGDSHLSTAELQAEVRPGSGWIAIDRNQDGRISRGEFEAVTQAFRPPVRDPVELVQDKRDAVRGGYSAQRLIGNEVRDLDGEPVGTVGDVLVNAAGAVTGLVIAAGRPPAEFRVPWTEAKNPPHACRHPGSGRERRRHARKRASVAAARNGA